MIMEKLNSKVNLLPMFTPYMRLKFLSELRDNIDFKNVNIIENLSQFVCMGWNVSMKSFQIACNWELSIGRTM